jgi:hypothetical protein
MRDLIQRNFYLKNRFGEIRNLLYDETGEALPPFFHTPDGLGFEFNVTTREIGNTLVITDILNNYVDISGELIFKDYISYESFVLWVENSQVHEEVILKPENYLRLYYQTTNNELSENAYFDIFISKIQKGEKSQDDGLLRCSVIFKKLSNIKKDVIYTVSNFGEVGPQPTFPLPTPQTNFIEFNKSMTNVITMQVTNPSNVNIPVQIKFKGSYTNPSWENITNNSKGQYMVQSALSTNVLIAEARPIVYVEENNINIFDKCAPYYQNLLHLSPGMNELKIILNSVTSGEIGLCEVTVTAELEAYTI